jgi:hypothetical protein
MMINRRVWKYSIHRSIDQSIDRVVGRDIHTHRDQLLKAQARHVSSRPSISGARPTDEEIARNDEEEEEERLCSPNRHPISLFEAQGYMQPLRICLEWRR